MQFLIIHMHGLGDMIMFAPAFNTLKNKKKYIDIIVFENNAISPIKSSPKINNIYYCNSSYLKFFFIVLRLMKKKYRKILFTNNSSPFKSILISMFLNSKEKKIISERSFSYNYFNNLIIKVNFKLHKIYRNILLVNRKLNKKEFDYSLHINFLKRKISNKRYVNIGIHPGSNIKNGDKRWSTIKFKKLIEYFEKKNCCIYIFIGDYEKELLKEFNFRSKKIKIINQKPINYVASLISDLNLFISNETGLAHLSSFLDTRTIVILNKKDEKEKTVISTPILNTNLIKSTKNYSDYDKIINLTNKLVH